MSPERHHVNFVTKTLQFKPSFRKIQVASLVDVANKCFVIVFCSEALLSQGEVECTDSNNLNSVCTFSCKEGFVLIDGSDSTCQDTGNVARWIPNLPQCPGKVYFLSFCSFICQVISAR